MLTAYEAGVLPVKTMASHILTQSGMLSCKNKQISSTSWPKPARVFGTPEALVDRVRNSSPTRAFDPFDYEQALLACACGDRDALRAIYDRDASWLLAVIVRIVRNRCLAEDLLQEAFVRIWIGSATFDPSRGSGRGWIYTVVRHRALQEMRYASIEISLDSADLNGLADARQANEAEQSSISSLELEQCLDQLEPQVRECIVQSFIQGFTHEQIALRVDAPLGTVKTWIRRGLLSLRDGLL